MSETTDATGTGARTDVSESGTERGAANETAGDAETGEPLLRVEGLRKSFGGIVAADDATFGVERGTITGLIGPNGAGKSTIFNLISGFYEPDGGQVTLRGQDITGMEPYKIANRGLMRTFQTPRKLEGMTVREAMLLGPRDQPGESFSQLFLSPGKVGEHETRNLERVDRILEEFELDHLATQPATDISGGQTKLVELARAMLAEPDILLLDEPVAGVNPALIQDLADQIRRLNEEGTTFLIIEHDMDFIMELADPIVVLDQGSVLMEGPPETVRTDDRVADAYLGGGGG